VDNTPPAWSPFNFFRPLDWRLRRARGLVADGRRGSPRRDDAATLQLVGYLRALGRCRAERDRAAVRKKWPDLDAARRLHEGGGPRRDEVEARLVAGQDDDAVAARCGLTPGAVAAYEAVHFHVRDRLAARDWLAGRVVGPGLWCGFRRGDRAGLWRALALLGGVPALEVGLAVSLGRPLPDWLDLADQPDPRYAAARLRLAARLLIEVLLDRPAGGWAALAAVRQERRRLEEDAGRPGPQDPRLGPLCALLDLADCPKRPAPARKQTPPAPRAGPEPAGRPAAALV
jgi:hypothetical protein